MTFLFVCLLFCLFVFFFRVKLMTMTFLLKFKMRDPAHYIPFKESNRQSFYIYSLFDFPIGCACDDLPSFLQNNKFLHTLQRDRHNCFSFFDSLLCFFVFCCCCCFFFFGGGGGDLSLYRGALVQALHEATVRFVVVVCLFVFSSGRPSAVFSIFGRDCFGA